MTPDTEIEAIRKLIIYGGKPTPEQRQLYWEHLEKKCNPHNHFEKTKRYIHPLMHSNRGSKKSASKSKAD